MKQSCCIQDYCGMPFDMDEPETRPTENLKAFWRYYCPKHRERTDKGPIFVNQPVEDQE